MSLQLLLGRSGTGKSEYIYNEIKQLIDNKEKIYILNIIMTWIKNEYKKDHI